MSQQPYYGPPQGYPQMPQQGYPQQPAMPAGPMPQFYEANDAQASQGFQQAAQAAAQFGPNPQFLRVPGPRGQTKWDGSVPVGWQGELTIHLMPPSAAGKQVFVEAKSHFYKSAAHPRGAVLGYAGEDSLWMQAIHMGMQNPDPSIQKMANDYGRVRRQWLYNAVDLSNPTTHYGQDGVMRPFILGAGSTLQADIGRLADTRGGISKLVHPVSGRPLRYMKKKTGVEEMNVEYGVLDLDPQPLNPYFYPALEHLWDLEAQAKVAAQEEMVKAIQELGLPMPATGQAFAQVPQSYNPSPNPAWPNPYPQQVPVVGPSMGLQYPQQQAQAGWGPPAPMMAPGAPMPQQPMGGQWGAPPPPPPPMGSQQMPQFAAPPPPPPVSSQSPMAGAPMPPPPMPMGPPMMQPPPPMAPPPVSSQVGASGYSQNPGAQMSPPPPNAAPPGQNVGPNGVPF